ncbi:hypothetical protein [Corynebacterium heidelbergense]|uniref:DUF2269 domain-containing protein n=1 Tax=Corynebacterium heidelbergense TaxID=2055947 RepID=A0A364VDZ5_9CORY|nr:hypothetical protein [Corynebacterium heidelbergense]RAV34841.1 hypothetical protein CWC39_01030 [Corynebacterium heidelbergense]WCZ36921.1 hypothetical protein CHEID_06940 [Corynebacterium heidelbergense]
MSHLFVFLHVVTAILFIGPVAVTTSMFAPTYRKAKGGDAGAAGQLRLLHRISRLYSMISLVVPVLGLILLFGFGEGKGEYGFHIATLLSIIAWAVLLFLVIPSQRRGLVAADALEAGDTPASEDEAAKARTNTTKLPGQLAMFAGIFNLLWFVTAILMFV